MAHMEPPAEVTITPAQYPRELIIIALPSMEEPQVIPSGEGTFLFMEKCWLITRQGRAS